MHPPLAPVQAGLHAPGSNPANPAAVCGGPTTFFVAALDKKLRAVEEAGGSGSGGGGGGGGAGLTVAAEVDVGAVLTQLVAPSPGEDACVCACAGWDKAREVAGASIYRAVCVCPPPAGGRLLFAAGDDGCVRSFRLPLVPAASAPAGSIAAAAGTGNTATDQPTTTQQQTQHQQQQQQQMVAAARCGSAAVTRIALIHDESTLFAATADGCLLVFDVKDRDAASSRLLMA